jgi:hypothetical protein
MNIKYIIIALLSINTGAQAALKLGTVGIVYIYNNYDGKVFIKNQEDGTTVELDKPGQHRAHIFIPWCNPQNLQQKLVIKIGNKQIDLCDSYQDGTIAIFGDIDIVKAPQRRIHNPVTGKDTGRTETLSQDGPKLAAPNIVSLKLKTLKSLLPWLPSYYLIINNDGSIIFEEAMA